MAQNLSRFNSTPCDARGLDPGRMPAPSCLSPSGAPDTSLTLGLPAYSAPEGLTRSPPASEKSWGQALPASEGRSRAVCQPCNEWEIGLCDGGSARRGEERDAPPGIPQQRLPGSSAISSNCFSPGTLSSEPATAPASAPAPGLVLLAESAPAPAPRPPPAIPEPRNNGHKRALDFGTAGEAPLSPPSFIPEELLLLAARCGLGPSDVEVAQQFLQQQILLQHHQQRNQQQPEQQILLQQRQQRSQQQQEQNEQRLAQQQQQHRNQQQQQQQQQNLHRQAQKQQWEEQQRQPPPRQQQPHQQQQQQQQQLRAKAPRLAPTESLASTSQEHPRERAHPYHGDTTPLITDVRLLDREFQPLTALNTGHNRAATAQGTVRQTFTEKQGLQAPKASTPASASTAFTACSGAAASGSANHKLLPFMPRLVLPCAKAREAPRLSPRKSGPDSPGTPTAAAGAAPTAITAASVGARILAPTTAPFTTRPPPLGTGYGQTTGTPATSPPALSTPGTGKSGVTTLGGATPGSCMPATGTPASCTPASRTPLTGTPAAGAPASRTLACTGTPALAPAAAPPGAGTPPQRAPAAHHPEATAGQTPPPARRLLDLNKAPVEASAWSQRLLERPQPRGKFSSPPEEGLYGPRGPLGNGGGGAAAAPPAEGAQRRPVVARERGGASSPLQRWSGGSGRHTASASADSGLVEGLPLAHLGRGQTAAGSGGVLAPAHSGQGYTAGQVAAGPLQAPEGVLARCEVGSGELGELGRPAAEDMLLYRCHVCGKSFAKSQSLGGHMNTHKRYNTAAKPLKTRLKAAAPGSGTLSERSLAPGPPPVTSAPPAALLVRPLPASMRVEGRGDGGKGGEGGYPSGAYTLKRRPIYGNSSLGQSDEDAQGDTCAEAGAHPERHVCDDSRHGQVRRAQLGSASSKGAGSKGAGAATDKGTPLRQAPRGTPQSPEQKGEQSSKSCISALLWPHLHPQPTSSSSDLSAPLPFPSHAPPLRASKSLTTGAPGSGDLTTKSLTTGARGSGDLTTKSLTTGALGSGDLTTKSLTTGTPGSGDLTSAAGTCSPLEPLRLPGAAGGAPPPGAGALEPARKRRSWVAPAAGGPCRVSPPSPESLALIPAHTHGPAEAGGSSWYTYRAPPSGPHPQLQRLQSLEEDGPEGPGIPGVAPCGGSGTPAADLSAQPSGLGGQGTSPGWAKEVHPSDGVMIMARLTAQQYKYWKERLEPELIQLAGMAASFP